MSHIIGQVDWQRVQIGQQEAASCPRRGCAHSRGRAKTSNGTCRGTRRGEHTGGQADELVKLATKINPRTEGELRFYIGKFPGKVRRLLAEGKKMCKSILERKQRHGGTPPRLPSGATTRSWPKDKKQEKKKMTKQEKKEKTKTEKRDTMERRDGDGDKDHEWTGETATRTPSRRWQLLLKTWGSHASDDDMVLPDILSHETNWPWGKKDAPQTEQAQTQRAQRDLVRRAAAPKGGR